MINNKQVSLWRGTDPPPTNYHVWLKKDEELLLYNGTEWVTFINNSDLIELILNLKLMIESTNVKVNSLIDTTNGLTTDVNKLKVLTTTLIIN